MKIIRTILLYAVLGVSIFLLWDKVLRTPCSRLIRYDIGAFDERFNIDREVFLSYVERAEFPWEKAANKELFMYTPGADFKINLIWSEDQERLYKGNDLEENLDSTQDSLSAIQNRYQSAVNRYERAAKEYESKLSAYEADVVYWNNKGGAPKKEYDALDREADSLDRKADEIKRLLANVNTLAEESNQKIERYNSEVTEYNNLFSEGHEFDAGNTDGTEINVYSYDGLRELETLLVHEFGHVLGIDHIDDRGSVMHYLLNSKNRQGKLSADDIAALGFSCKL